MDTIIAQPFLIANVYISKLRIVEDLQSHVLSIANNYMLIHKTVHTALCVGPISVCVAARRRLTLGGGGAGL